MRVRVVQAKVTKAGWVIGDEGRDRPVEGQVTLTIRHADGLEEVFHPTAQVLAYVDDLTESNVHPIQHAVPLELEITPLQDPLLYQPDIYTRQFVRYVIREESMDQWMQQAGLEKRKQYQFDVA